MEVENGVITLNDKKAMIVVKQLYGISIMLNLHICYTYILN